jgi:hypothetical protein
MPDYSEHYNHNDNSNVYGGWDKRHWQALALVIATAVILILMGVLGKKSPFVSSIQWQVGVNYNVGDTVTYPIHGVHRQFVLRRPLSSAPDLARTPPSPTNPLWEFIIDMP